MEFEDGLRKNPHGPFSVGDVVVMDAPLSDQIPILSSSVIKSVVCDLCTTCANPACNHVQKAETVQTLETNFHLYCVDIV